MMAWVLQSLILKAKDFQLFDISFLHCDKNLPARRFFSFTFGDMELSVHHIFILISAIVGFILLINGNLPAYMRLLPFFLVLTLILELIGRQMGVRGINNTIYYNLFSILSFIYYWYIIHQILRSGLVKRILLFCMIGYPLLSLVNIFYIQGPHVFHTMTYSFGSLLTIIFCVYFFYELFRIPHSINLKTHPGFWIVTGLLFFNACTLPFIGLANYIYQFSPVLIKNLKFILSFLNVLLYLLFTIAFLCRLNFQRSMS